MASRILVVADEPVVGALVDALRDTFEVAAAGGASQALPLIDAEAFLVVVLGLAGAAGLAVLRAALARSRRTRFVLLAVAAEAEAIALVERGAGARLEGPAHPEALVRAVERALPYREAVDVARVAAARRYLEALLREFGGNVTRAADRAGMDRENLHRLLRRYDLRAGDFRDPAAPAPGGRDG